MDALAHSWPLALRKYAYPTVSLLAQILCKLREGEEQVLLVAPYWSTWTWFPEIISLATACVAPGRDVEDLSGLPAVVESITQARSPSTRQA